MVEIFNENGFDQICICCPENWMWSLKVAYDFAEFFHQIPIVLRNILT